MKYIKQLMIILIITFIGEILHALIPLPIPAGIYGLVILFAALETGLLPLSVIKETAHFLLKILPIMFIPAGVELITAWDALRPIIFPLLIIIVLSTVTVMVSSGHVTQFLLRHGRPKTAEEGVSCNEHDE